MGGIRANWDRRKFIRAVGAGIGVLVGRRLIGAHEEAQPSEEAYLMGIDIVRYRRMRRGREEVRRLLRVTTQDGAIGGAHGFFSDTELPAVAAALRGINILDHERMWDLLLEKQPGSRRTLAVVDNACWDVHARMQGAPLYDLLGGRKRESYPTYGDERWRDGMTPEQYAQGVARSFASRGMLGTKLHLPGTYPVARGDGKDGLPVRDICTALARIRDLCGDEVMIACDPHPQGAAADRIEDARQILEVLNDNGYEWVEGPIDPNPQEERIPQYVELRKHARLRFELEGLRADDPVATRIRWAEAGAVDQWNFDCTTSGAGITGCLRLIQWIREHPKTNTVLNLHYKADAHQQIAAALEPEICPWTEAMFVQGRYRDGFCAIPQWIGVEDLDWDYIAKNRIA
jgi:L-alanine-DL-glutamate epimerase-like enolase superfamily enzyme